MKNLNKDSLQDLTNKKILNFNPKNNKVIQFGGGNFLRAFVDFYLDKLNHEGLFDSGVTLIKATPQNTSTLSALEEQDFNYTLIERGIDKGEIISKHSIIDILTDIINPYTDFKAYLECARSESLRFVVSNTTEAGIVYDSTVKFEDQPQTSFPGKVTRLLYERFKHFAGDKSKGLVFLPCELIVNNGSTLRQFVIQHSKDWNLGEDFITWVSESNYFTNTLVDRIVPGFPRDEISELNKTLGYIDNCIVTTELFNFWAIEGPTWLQEELPFHKLGLNVVWTEDVTPFKSRKVRILNGGHTSTVLAGYLSGYRTVGEMLDCNDFNALLSKILFEEVIPTLDLPKEDLVNFGNSVFDRFKNPFIKHYLHDISLNSVSKYKARVTPSIIKYYEINKKLPTALTFSFASLICFYRGLDEKNENFEIRDDKEIVEYFGNLWDSFHNGNLSLSNLVEEFASNEEYFGEDFSKYNNFVDDVVFLTQSIIDGDIKTTVKSLI